MLGALKRLLGKGQARMARGPMRASLRPYDWQRVWGSLVAKYDSAQTTDENRRHWINADGLSANSANDLATRKVLRNRARYEVSNNTHAKNILLSIANFTIGTGPRLQMTTDDKALNRIVENEFTRWMLAIDLAAKLRTMRMAKCEDGEAFALFTNRANASRVALDLKLIEADQVTALYGSSDPLNIDGVILDEYGIPVTYQVLKQHPGDALFTAQDVQTISAKFVLHYLRQDRPGQARGVPELTPALPMFALLRRYVLAVLTSAESAASFAAVMRSTMPPQGDESGEGAGTAASIPAGMSIEIERNMITSLPEGWDLTQVKAEQPTATFSEFHDKILGAIGCVLGMPFNVVACNSSGYNYASGRLDYQGYDLSLRVERAVIEQQILDRVFKAWLDEAVLVEGYLPQAVRRLDANFDHQWFWDGRDHVDPSKEAAAQETRLRNGTTTLAYEYAKTGRDYETETAQWSREVKDRFDSLMTAGFTREETLNLLFRLQTGSPPAAVAKPQEETANAE